MRITCGGVVCAAIAIVALAGCASSGPYQTDTMKPPRQGDNAVTPAANAKKRMTRIVVTGSKHQCEATIDDKTITGKRGKKILWLVEDQSSGCAPREGDPNADWHIELEFQSAWNNGRDRIVKIDRDDFEDVRVHPNAAPTSTPHEYDVYLVFPRVLSPDVRIKVIDPELVIEM